MNREERIPGLLGADLRGKFVILPGRGIGVGRHSLLRHQSHGVAAERAVHEWLLAIAGRAQHLVTHAAEGDPKIDPGVVMLFSSALVNGLLLVSPSEAVDAGLRRERNQRIGDRHLELGQTAADRAGRQRILHGVGERIVPAGIEDDQPQPLDRLQKLDDPIERDRFVLDVEIALEHRVDRHQKMVPSNSMP